MVNVLTFSSRK